MGIFTRTGGTIAFFGEYSSRCLSPLVLFSMWGMLGKLIRSLLSAVLAAMGFTFSFTQAATSNIRQVCSFSSVLEYKTPDFLLILLSFALSMMYVVVVD
jgi:hypothetical protein